MRSTLLVLGSLLPLLSAIAYIISIVRGETRPQRMTRFLMVVITGIMTASLWAGHDTSGVWLALASFVQAVVILGLSFGKGMGGSDPLDWACLVLCGVGIWLWLASGESWAGLISSIVADAIACIPALVKTIRHPHTELTAFYALDAVAGVIIVFAGPFTLAAMIFPLYIFLINAVFVAAIRWPRQTALAAGAPIAIFRQRSK